MIVEVKSLEKVAAGMRSEERAREAYVEERLRFLEKRRLGQA